MNQKYNLIICKVRDCGYHSPSNFCLRPLSEINERGSCGYVYNNNGSVNNYYTASVDSNAKLNFGAERLEQRSLESSEETLGIGAEQRGGSNAD